MKYTEYVKNNNEFQCKTDQAFVSIETKVDMENGTVLCIVSITEYYQIKERDLLININQINKTTKLLQSQF